MRGERLSRHDYGRSIHNLRLTGGGEYAMPCGRESPWGCEPRLLHFFFRRSTAERLAENSYTTAEKRAKLVNSTKRLIEAQRVSAASETVACGREAGRLRQSICRLAPAPIHTSVVDALRKRWARAAPSPPRLGVRSPRWSRSTPEAVDEPLLRARPRNGSSTRGRG